MKRRSFLAGIPLFLALPHTLRACLWDTDTVAAEAKGREDLLGTITGRFDRFPPRYYEMRIARVTASIPKMPERLDLYDDAAVACDRLGRGDEAIAWMEKKKATLDREPLEDVRKIHAYRHLANLGTFHAHRWLHDGADDTKLAEVEKAAECIRAAIALNKDAHFGRERYQLKALEWLLTVRRGGQIPPVDHKANRLNSDPEIIDRSGTWGLSFLGLYPVDVDWSHAKNNLLKETGMEDAVAGVSGLIQLGAAWESVDIFLALSVALTWTSENALAALAGLRMRELLAAGKKSLDPKSPLSWKLVESQYFNPGFNNMDGELNKPTYDYFRAARKEADAWQKARHTYAEARFAKGKHPDTDPDFWKAWREPSSPPTPPGTRKK